VYQRIFVIFLLVAHIIKRKNKFIGGPQFNHRVIQLVAAGIQKHIHNIIIIDTIFIDCLPRSKKREKNGQPQQKINDPGHEKQLMLKKTKIGFFHLNTGRYTDKEISSKKN
jgi:hypothetical protein